MATSQPGVKRAPMSDARRSKLPRPGSSMASMTASEIASS